MTLTDPGSLTKPRGCFQCSKRRIICDRGEPTCFKCVKKGIECSGLGRFRFSPGVATRGKLKGRTIPVLDATPEAGNRLCAKHPTPPIRWKQGRNKIADKCTQGNNRKAPVDTGRDKGAVRTGDTELPDRRTENAQAEGEQEMAVSTSPIRPWIAPISSETRQFFDYFAQVVAPVMVVLDVSNGYRDILLPMAFEDELLQEAIVVVATQHLVPRQPALQAAADSRRSAVITRLREASQHDSPDLVFNLSTWATLIVLLVGETVTGSSEYIHLLRTLLTLSKNIRNPGNPSLDEFLTKQTDMFAFLGQPLLNEGQGVEKLRTPIDPGVWMPSGIKQHHNQTLSLVKQVFCKGVQIYLQRVTTNQNSWETLEDLRQLLCHIDPAEPGAHGFVWSCFIAAADSTDPQHREFFSRYMEAIHAKTLFHNIPKALAVLPTIWQLQGTRKWTEVLPSLSPILIM
ncbi:hypothetical protein BO71DRAFT_443549 [Aspergillus ellipticus CBS 707.79]|uniref:Zn(2)-C6 fungal-type domain-containing protein n=1 Tax=Aspergillus ellipticus CBS 707.79 TaxID=1448320 RepID=A0A319DS92_9EURO|nr:hypothetical protein BO71DRAFT_443549 [Aspergillus ellipticus CBS 707.79]